MRLFLLIAALIWPLVGAPGSCRAKPIRIGIIDTGFGYRDHGSPKHLCRTGHQDFSTERVSHLVGNILVPDDIDNHGTNIAGLIDANASKGSTPYCFVILKYYSSKQTGYQNLMAGINALRHANKLKLDVLNYSGGGPVRDDEEYLEIKKFLDRGGLVFAAAGNDSAFLDGVVNAYYPAMYDRRIFVVGNLDSKGQRVESSNYGPFVNTWENGTDQTGYGITLSGTSQATAVTTGKKIAALTCDK